MIVVVVIVAVVAAGVVSFLSQIFSIMESQRVSILHQPERDISHASSEFMFHSCGMRFKRSSVVTHPVLLHTSLHSKCTSILLLPFTYVLNKVASFIITISLVGPQVVVQLLRSFMHLNAMWLLQGRVQHADAGQEPSGRREAVMTGIIPSCTKEFIYIYIYRYPVL